MAITKQPTDAERSVALVLRSHATSAPVDAFVRSEVPVFGGKMFTITFKTQEGRLVDSFVFTDGKVDHHFFNPGELSRFFNNLRPNNTTSSLVRDLVSTGGAPALIAVIITATICYSAIRGLTTPDILGNALTTILGFYFGSKVSDRIRHSSDEPR